MRESNQNNREGELDLTADLGWDQMSLLLDKELPTKRSTPMYLKWGAGLLCLISVGAIVFWFTTNTSEPANIVPKIKTDAPIESPGESMEHREIAYRSATQPTDKKISSTKSNDSNHNSIANNNGSAKSIKSFKNDKVTTDSKVSTNVSNKVNVKNNQELGNALVSVNSIVSSIETNTKYSIASSQNAVYPSGGERKAPILARPQIDGYAYNKTLRVNQRESNQVTAVPQLKMQGGFHPTTSKNDVSGSHRNKLGKSVNHNLSDFPKIYDESSASQFALSQSNKKEIDFLPVKTEKPVNLNFAGSKKINLPDLKPEKKRIELGLFLASTYGIKGTIGGRAGVSISSKVAKRTSIHLDPNYSHVMLTLDSSLLVGSNEVSLPISAMYRTHRALGVSVGAFAGYYSKRFVNQESSNRPITFSADSYDEQIMKAANGKKKGLSYGALLGIHWFVKPKFKINLGYENSLASFNQESKFLRNGQISFGLGYQF